MKLKAAIDLWLGEHIATTKKSYTYPMKLFTDHMGTSRAVSLITPVELVQYFQEVIIPQNNAVATYNKHVKTLRTFFNWCVNMEIIKKSPARVIKMKAVQRGISRDKAMTDQELAAIIDYVKYKPRDHAMILFLADTGCRRGGVAGLKMGDINWKRKRATVTEKGDISREVSFGEDCAVSMRRWIASRGENNHVTGVYVFTHDGEKMNPENVSQIIRRVCEKLKIRVRSAHSLRHRKGHAFGYARVAPTLAAAYLGNTPEIVIKHYYPDDYDSAEREAQAFMTDTFNLSQQAPNVLSPDEKRWRKAE
jgi:integrase